MKALIFQSRTVEGLNYIILEDGRFGGAFNHEVPEEITDGYDVEVVSAENAPTHQRLLAALELNRKRSQDGTPVIYLFGEKPDGGPGMYFAMAESGYVLAVELCRNSKRARWMFGDKALSHCIYLPMYTQHYPDGFKIEYVPHDKIKTHQGLTQARIQNQMLADIKGASPKQGAE